MVWKRTVLQQSAVSDQPSVKRGKLKVKSKSLHLLIAVGRLFCAFTDNCKRITVNFVFLASLLLVMPVYAQDQCGVVTSIAFPVDRSMFHLAQEFSVPSPRHQGRYHTGEDWYGGRGTSYGQPVRAMADGRVTYSAPTGWGRDLGVVIIEHTFPDGSIAYSMYGHMEESETHLFPARYSCIKGGDIVGVVGNARPAPHLHFEIRTNQPDVPGAGYTPEFPTLLGWRQPSRFVLDWGTWLLPSHAWHLDAGANLVAPPLELSDHSLLFLDSTRLRDSTPDGRVLWRINLEKRGIGLMDFRGLWLLVYADGSIQVINPDGTLGENYWSANTAIDGAYPAVSSNYLLLHTADNALILFDADLREAVWRLEDIPPVIRAKVTASSPIALITVGNEIWLISEDGKVLDQAHLNEPASLSPRSSEELLAFTQGGLWQIDRTGTWALAIEHTPPGGASSAVLQGGDGRLFLLSGNDTHTLGAYNPDGSPTWQVGLPDVSGAAELTQYDNVLLLITSSGHIVAVQAESGGLCNRTQIYGDERAQVWHSLGDDGILRVALADQILGLNWAKFIGGCKP
jgi:murein DD-endopeptidase MepM/ murein hydrolase activator NlpD